MTTSKNSREVIVRGSFDRAVGTYGGCAVVQTAMAEWLAEWLPSSRGGRALELGAGTGVFTRRLLPWSGGLVATDLSQAMCRAARETFPQVDWQVMSAEEPVGVDYAWLFTSSMLQWVENPRRVFSAWSRVLCPGGRVLAGFFVEGSLPELRAMTHGWTPLTWRLPEEWSDCLVQAGLRVVRAETDPRVFYHESALALLKSLHGVGAAPFHRFTPGRLRRILREYDRLHGDERGVKSTWVFHRFEAERAG